MNERDNNHIIEDEDYELDGEPQQEEESGRSPEEEEEIARLQSELEEAKTEAEEAESDASQAEAESETRRAPRLRPSRAGVRQSDANPPYDFDERNIVSTYGEWAVTYQGMANLRFNIFISADMLHMYTKEHIESRYPYADADQFRRVHNDAVEYHNQDE